MEISSSYVFSMLPLQIQTNYKKLEQTLHVDEIITEC